jgi:hypothetical protein
MLFSEGYRSLNSFSPVNCMGNFLELTLKDFLFQIRSIYKWKMRKNGNKNSWCEHSVLLLSTLYFVNCKLIFCWIYFWMTQIIHILSRVGDACLIRLVLDWMIGFIAPYTFTQLGTTGNYSAIALLHPSEFTVSHTLGFSVFTSHILATDLSQSPCYFK